MTYLPLRALTIGEILDGAVRLYRRHFGAIGRYLATILIPVALATVLMGGGSHWFSWEALSVLPFFITLLQSGQPADELLRMFGFQLFGALFIQLLLVSTLLPMLATFYLGDVVPSIAQHRIGIRGILPLFPALLVMVPLNLLVLQVVQTLPALVYLAQDDLGASSLGMLAEHLPLLGQDYLWSLVVVALCAPFSLTGLVVIFENASPLQSLRRSWSLTRKALPRTLAVTFAICLITALVVALPDTLLALRPLDPLAMSLPIRITTLLTQVLMFLALPLQLAVLTVLYVDLRVRQESFDLEINLRRTQQAEIEPLQVSGEQKFQAGDLSGALLDFDAALRIDPEDVHVRCFRMGVLIRQGRLEAALADAEHMLRRFPDGSWALRNRGYVRALLGDQIGADADYDTAFRVQRSFPTELERIAAEREAEGELRAARIDYTQLLRHTPTYDPALYALARIDACQGDTDAALVALEQAIDLSERWRQQAQSDTAFATLRDDPRFAALLSRNKQPA